MVQLTLARLEMPGGRIPSCLTNSWKPPPVTYKARMGFGPLAPVACFIAAPRSGAAAITVTHASSVASERHPQTCLDVPVGVDCSRRGFQFMRGVLRGSEVVPATCASSD